MGFNAPVAQATLFRIELELAGYILVHMTLLRYHLTMKSCPISPFSKVLHNAFQKQARIVVAWEKHGTVHHPASVLLELFLRPELPRYTGPSSHSSSAYFARFTQFLRKLYPNSKSAYVEYIRLLALAVEGADRAWGCR